MSLSTKILVVNLADDLEVSGSHRSLRRILINAEILKSTRVFAGDVVAVKSIESDTDNSVSLVAFRNLHLFDKLKTYAIGIAWPSVDVAHDCQWECVRYSQG